MDIEQYFEYTTKSCTFSFDVNYFPRVDCPCCDSGQLKINENEFHFIETVDSIKNRNHEDWEPDWIEYQYHCFLTCDTCSRKISSSGVGKHNYYLPAHPDDEYYEEDIFRPLFFNPTLELFRIHKKCPKRVKKLLNDSFSLAWSDVSSACNKLRISIEKLLVEIHPVSENQGTLHNRIKSFEAVNSEVSKLLMAIKWLGNSASHDDSLKEYDLAFAYEVMEQVLNKLFDDREQRLMKLVEVVNESKGRIPN